jgi:oligopeptide transport system substrate-binding protein
MEELGLGSNPSDLKVKLAFGDTTANGRTYAELYQQMWQNSLGVTVDIDFNETATHLSNVNSGDYQIACVSWGSTVEPSFQLSRWATPQGGQSRWVNDKYVSLVSSAMENMDESKRLELYQQAEDLIISEAAIVPTYYTANKTFAYNYVGGIPTGAFDTTGMKTLYITEQ